MSIKALGVITKLILALCLLAAVVSIVLAYVSNTRLMTGDPSLVLLVLGPYGLLALLAWRLQKRPVLSKVLLGLVVLLAALGLYAFGMDTYTYLTEPGYDKRMRLVFYVPVIQLFAALVAGVVLLGVALMTWQRGQANRV
jgi:hypothetical protein